MLPRHIRIIVGKVFVTDTAIESGRSYGIINILRSAVFLASIMVILEHHYVLEWLDVVMIRIVTAVYQRTPAEEPIEALVFTIEEGLFETEFKARTPIDRKKLREYLERLVDTYKPSEFDKFKVLAIDYDLSPSNYNAKLYEEKNQCDIDDPAEKESQESIDNFLADLVTGLVTGKELSVVLIEPLPVSNPYLCECKKRWQQDREKQGILFGNPTLLQFGLLGPVMKYTEYTGYKDGFPTVALTAKKDCEKEDPQSSKALKHASLYPINYVQAYTKGAVQVCELNDDRSFDECKRYFSKNIHKNKNIHCVRAIFFGGDYGKDDTYVTPLGAMPGVTVQAYTYFSIAERLKPHPWWVRWKPLFAWLFDIVLGFWIGLIFHLIWQKFHDSRRRHEFSGQAGWAAGNFLVLIACFALLMFIAIPLLNWGIWLNPALIVIGLFIDSYITAITTGTHTSASFTSSLYPLFGIPGHSVVLRRDLFFHGLLKIAIFWIVVGLALYMLITHH
jgi:hypothetical protein